MIQVFLAMWKDVAPAAWSAMWPDDPDGNAWSDPNVGFPQLAEAGYTLVDLGRFPLGDRLHRPDLAVQGRRRRDRDGRDDPARLRRLLDAVPAARVPAQGGDARQVLLFPVAAYANPIGLSSEIWWSDRHPTTSSLTGQTSADLAAAYEAATGRQWTQPVGYVHSLFEVAHRRPEAGRWRVRQAGAAGCDGATNLETIAGKVDFTNPVVPHVTRPRSWAANGWRARSGTSSSRSSPTSNCPASRSTARWSRSRTDRRAVGARADSVRNPPPMTDLSAPASAIDVIAVSKSFGTPVIEHLSFAVARGEAVGSSVRTAPARRRCST